MCALVVILEIIKDIKVVNEIQRFTVALMFPLWVLFDSCGSISDTHTQSDYCFNKSIVT